MTSLTMMRTDRIRARLYEERKTIRPKGSPEGTPGIEIPSGHWAVHDGRDTFALAPDAFAARFVKLGSHWAERSKRISVEFEDGRFLVAGLEVPADDVLGKCAWCDDDGVPLAFGTDPIDAVLASAVARGRSASSVVDVLGTMRAGMSGEYTDEMRRFDAIWTKDLPEPEKPVVRFFIRDPSGGEPVALDEADIERMGLGFLVPK